MQRSGDFFRFLLSLLPLPLIPQSFQEGLAEYFRTQFLYAHFKYTCQLAAAEENRLNGQLNGQLNDDMPFISFVAPLYDSRPKYLDKLLGSFRQQTGPKCELVLSDDGSSSIDTLKWLKKHSDEADIRVVRSPRNRGIAAATNAGILAASGKWVGLIDHDDMLAPFAVARIARTLERKPNCQFLYTDEILVDERGKPIDYFFKPAWDPVLLSGVNYINHLSLYRRDRLLALGGLRDGFEGSQDYDLVLRYSRDLRPDEINHLPYPAYMWRRYDESYSSKFLENATLSARKALGERYAYDSRPALVEAAPLCDLHRVRFDQGRTDWPLVSIVIPSRNAFPLIKKVLAGLTEGTTYPSIEIIIIDNGTTDPDVLALYERYRRGSIPFHVQIEPAPFNFSASVNKGIALAKGSHVLLLNNDIEILEPDWLKELVSCLSYPNVGIVGAKLIYADGKIQHAGVIAGLGGLAGHWFVEQPDDFPGPMGRLRVRQSFTVVTGACLLVSQECLQAVGTFDEATFPIAYNDVDFCLRAASKGFRAVWTPFAKLIHHESASRGSDETPANIQRFINDQQSLRERHNTADFQDLFYSPWYSRDHSCPDISFLKQLPVAR